MIQTVLILIALLAVVPVNAANTGKSDLSKEIQGSWQLTKGVLVGNPMPANVVAHIRLELSDGKYVLTGAESPDQGTWTLHPDLKPVGIDVTGTDGPNKGKTYLAIVQLHGDKMKICYDLSGQSRPAKFESKKNTSLFLAEYKRVAP